MHADRFLRNNPIPPVPTGAKAPPAPADAKAPPAPAGAKAPPAPAGIKAPPAPADVEAPPAPAGVKAPPAPAGIKAPPAPAGIKAPPAPADVHVPPPPPEQVPPPGSGAVVDGRAGVDSGATPDAIRDQQRVMSFFLGEQLAKQMELHGAVKVLVKAWAAAPSSAQVALVTQQGGPLKEHLQRVAKASEPVFAGLPDYLELLCTKDFAWMDDDPPLTQATVVSPKAKDGKKHVSFAGQVTPTCVVMQEPKPRYGELTHDESKLLKSLAVQTYFVEIRSLLRTQEGEYAISNQHLMDWMSHFSPVAVATCPVKYLVPWAEHICTHPMLNVEFEKVVDLVKRAKIRTALDLAEGGMQLEILGVMVQIFVEKLRKQRRHWDPTEKDLAFSVKVGNLICTKAALLGAGKLALAHHLGIVELAKGAGTWLPEHEDEKQECAVPVFTRGRVPDGVPPAVPPGSDGNGGPRTQAIVLKFPKRICEKCGGAGHRKGACTSKDGATLKCWRCKGVGHPVFKCPSEVVE